MGGVGVVLSGCGYIDGSDVLESTLFLYHLEEQGFRPVVFAPNMPQSHVANHLTEENTPDVRNVLVESSRIARGDAFDIRRITPRGLDALFVPGGFGVLKHLSSFAFAGIDCGVITPLREVIVALHGEGKLLGFSGTGVVVAARVLEGSGVKLAVDETHSFDYVVSELGCTPVQARCGEIVVDEEHKVVSATGFMGGCSIKDVSDSIGKMVVYLGRNGDGKEQGDKTHR